MSDDSAGTKSVLSDQDSNGTGALNRELRDHKRTTVRFSDEEYERVIEETKLSGLSIPALLKGSHFRQAKQRLLFDEAERHVVCQELRRIGNNVNQIARRVNSGVLEGWHEEFAEVLQKLLELHHMAAGAYGAR